jgi:hypothetical protein
MGNDNHTHTLLLCLRSTGSVETPQNNNADENKQGNNSFHALTQNNESRQQVIIIPLWENARLQIKTPLPPES